MRTRARVSQFMWIGRSAGGSAHAKRPVARTWLSPDDEGVHVLEGLGLLALTKDVDQKWPALSKEDRHTTGSQVGISASRLEPR